MESKREEFAEQITRIEDTRGSKLSGESLGNLLSCEELLYMGRSA